MRTDDLVTMLATGAGAVQPNQALRRYAVAVGAGALVALLLMAILLGPRPDLAAAVLRPIFWVKVAFAGSLAAANWLAVLRLSRPGMRLAGLPGALAAPVLAIWLLAAIALARTDAPQRAAMVMGDTANSCPLLIALLSVPVFIAIVWTMKGLAPTRLRLAGASAGFLAGAVGTLVYSLHCPETAVPFVAVWYLLGMLIPAAAGAWLGPRLLRW